MVYRYRFISDQRAAESPARVYTVRAKVWVYTGAAAWYFVSVPVTTSRKIRTTHGVSARGWGSLPVTVKAGEVEWRTSIFPESKSGTYLLPLKADIRRRVGIRKGEAVTLELILAAGIHRGASST